MFQARFLTGSGTSYDVSRLMTHFFLRHFRAFSAFSTLYRHFSTCRWSPNRREIIYYLLFADTKSIFRPLSIFKLKKTPKKCPDLWPTTVVYTLSRVLWFKMRQKWIYFVKSWFKLIYFWYFKLGCNCSCRGT